MNNALGSLLVVLLLTLSSLSGYASDHQRYYAKHHHPQCVDDEVTSSNSKHSAHHKKSHKKSSVNRHKHNKHHHKHGCHSKQDYHLLITLDGAGSGRVSSEPAGIHCQNDCSEDYARNTEIVLSAQEYTGSEFVGWSGGGCSGDASCQITMNADTTISAQFARIEPPVLNLMSPFVDKLDMREIRDFFNAQHSYLPWGRIHDGLDIYPNDHLKPFQAACSGRVKKIYPFDEQVTVLIDCDPTYTIEYNFEAQSPNTGQLQLSHILVTEEQQVTQGEVIGFLYSIDNPSYAHVHFTLYENGVPICPEAHVTPTTQASILELIAMAHQDVLMCFSANVTSPPLLTPYYNEVDMANITAGFSSKFSFSPWDMAHNGLDMYPQGDLKPFQAVCAGVVDTVELQTSANGLWQVQVAVLCDDYVVDPDVGNYFIPLTTKYYFKIMSTDAVLAQEQLNNSMVTAGQTVEQGDTIGYLKAVNQEAHVHFELVQFGQAEFQVYGVTGIPLCPEAHFTSQARNSILNLLHVTWPGAGMCY